MAGVYVFPGVVKSVFAPYLYIVAIQNHLFLEEKTIFATNVNWFMAAQRGSKERKGDLLLRVHIGVNYKKLLY